MKTMTKQSQTDHDTLTRHARAVSLECSAYLRLPLRSIKQAMDDICARRARDHATKHMAGQRIRAQLRLIISGKD